MPDSLPRTVPAPANPRFIALTPDSPRSALSCFSDVLRECLPRHPGIGRAFVIQESSVAKEDGDLLIADGLARLAGRGPFPANDFVFIDRSTEAGTLRGRVPMIARLCADAGFPLRNVLYVSQSSLRVVPAGQRPDAEAPGWVHFHSYALSFARAHRDRAPPPGDAPTDRVLCLNGKLRPQRIAVAIAARRTCGERLLLSWQGGDSLYSLGQARREFEANFPALASEAFDLPASSLPGDPQLGNVLGLPAGPASASFLHLVTESDYLPWSDRFTEKLLKPVLAGRPFLVFGPAGVLARFRELGFRTFGDVFDESYDGIPDPGERLAALMATLDRLLRRDHQEVLDDTAATCAHNRAFLRTGLESRLLGLFERRLGELAG